MKIIQPKVKSTQASPDGREWLPSTFSNVQRELDYLSCHCDGDNPIALFRGQTNSQWLLDCTLVRTVLRLQSHNNGMYPRSMNFHTQLTDILLRKFGAFWQPSQEAREKQITNNIDAWYELMKRFQQYAKEDSEPKGTFLIDWTFERNIALYFATFTGRGASRKPRETSGALWVWDPVPTGKVLQTKKLGDLFPLMQKEPFRLQAAFSMPLILHPSKQSFMLRAVRQKAIYVSQMDYRYDLADVWCSVEYSRNCSVFKKIILRETVLADSIAHLERSGVTEDYVYPD